MNQQEWIEYFELVNGRKPTPAELAQAQAAGEFILERPNPNVFGSNGQATEQRPIKPAEPVITMTQQPQFAQTTATFQQVVPAKKGMSKKTKIILASVLGAVAVILRSVGGYSLWRYQSGKIVDGTYEVGVTSIVRVRVMLVGTEPVAVQLNFPPAPVFQIIAS